MGILPLARSQKSMRTPAGTECKYFYGNYFRGRSEEECRMLQASGQEWTASLCNTCPVPAVLQANACEFLQLRGTVTRPLASVFQRRVQISAYCDKVGRAVREPEIGCGSCHELPREFLVKE
jgi:hypothetical protein